MEIKQKLVFYLYFFFFVVLLLGICLVEGSSHHLHYHSGVHGHIRSRGNYIGVSKLFVFGDSYADIGNNKESASSWKMPYGITFPGKPSGRYSDGHIITDYIASYLRIKSPVPYRFRETGKESLKDGMNFAYGGTGVFDTYASDPNMTTQIDFLERLIKDDIYTKSDLSSSIAHVSVVGNDYGYYLMRKKTTEGLIAFITTVVTQIKKDLTRIHDLGVRKVIVTSLPPLGCLPIFTTLSSFQSCNQTLNALVDIHNQLLQAAVAKLNNGSTDSAFGILDLTTAFLSVIKNQGSLKFKNPLMPCCSGASIQNTCGDTDEKGAKIYTVCRDPTSSFFWDRLHPSQQGWLAVYSTLRDSLNKLYY